MPIAETAVAGDPFTATQLVELAKYINRAFKAGIVEDFYGLSSDVPTGYLLADGKTIGDASSNATARANADMTTLFEILWNLGNSTGNVAIYTSAGAVSSYGANAAADFAAHKAIELPNIPGRTTVGAGTGTKVWTIASVNDTNDQLTVPTNKTLLTGQAVVYTAASPATGLVSTTTYYVVRVDATHVRLASTRANALAGTYIDITSAGSGTQTLTQTLTARTVGELLGEEDHSLVVAELPSFTPKYNRNTQPTGTGTGRSAFDSSTGGNTNFTTLGGDTPHNNVQPSIVVNKIISTGVVW